MATDYTHDRRPSPTAEVREYDADCHGNRVRQEGVDRCPCGSKYWEDDRCIDCGGTTPTD